VGGDDVEAAHDSCPHYCCRSSHQDSVNDDAGQRQGHGTPLAEKACAEAAEEPSDNRDVVLPYSN